MTSIRRVLLALATMTAVLLLPPDCVLAFMVIPIDSAAFYHSSSSLLQQQQQHRSSCTGARTIRSSCEFFHKLHYSNNPGNDDDNNSDAALPLPLSTSDVVRLQALRLRSTAAAAVTETAVRLPVMILDALVPGQVVTVRSSDPTFWRMLDHCVTNCDSKVAVIGEHPFLTGRPLSFGVVAKVEPFSEQQQFQHANTDTAVSAVTVRITALQQRIRLIQHQGSSAPQLLEHDDDAPFSMAECELLTDDDNNDNEQGLSSSVAPGYSADTAAKNAAKASQLAEKLPELIQQWKKHAIAAGVVTDEAVLIARERVLGGAPKPDGKSPSTYWTALAFYVAVLLNPPPLSTTATTAMTLRMATMIDIRPAMLSAGTSYERLLLAATALQCSMDHGNDHR